VKVENESGEEGRMGKGRIGKGTGRGEERERKGEGKSREAPENGQKPCI